MGQSGAPEVQSTSALCHHLTLPAARTLLHVPQGEAEPPRRKVKHPHVEKVVSLTTCQLL